MLATDAATNTVVAGPRSELATRTAPDPRRAAAPRPRSASTGSAFATTRPGATAALELSGDPSEAVVALAEPVDGAAPGQVACLLDGDLVVGHGTIV